MHSKGMGMDERNGLQGEGWNMSCVTYPHFALESQQKLQQAMNIIQNQVARCTAAHSRIFEYYFKQRIL
jgi:hypothetical protein